MAHKKPTITIGIPVYNEQLNIKRLLTSLLAQDSKSFSLKEILIICDGCTDNTLSEIKSVKNRLIKVVVGKERLGQCVRLNQIIKLFNSDYLVLTEGDLLPVGQDLLEQLMTPLIKSKAKIASSLGFYKPSKAIGLYEQTISYGSDIKKTIFNKWNAGKNVYVLGGHSIKAIPKNVAKKFVWPNDVPEDSYFYLKLFQSGYSFIKCSNCQMVGGETKEFSDTKKQSEKFLSGINSLRKYFPKQFIDSQFNISKAVILKTIIFKISENPLMTILFSFEFIFNRLFVSRGNYFNPKYEIYSSSKKIN